MAKTEPIQIYVDRELKEKFLEAVDKTPEKNRSLVIRQLMQEFVERQNAKE